MIRYGLIEVLQSYIVVRMKSKIVIHEIITIAIDVDDPVETPNAF